MNNAHAGDNDELKNAVEQLHKCRAVYLEEVAVIEKYGPDTVWEGIVHVFKLTGHPQVDKCYAWYSDTPDTRKRKYYAVLHIPPIDSPEKAVRASIVLDNKRKQ
jgi:hypothetical protein